MARVLDGSTAAAVIGGMLGCSDVDGGPTDEQRSVIAAMATGYYHQPEAADAPPLGPDELAAALSTDAERRRARELLVLAELCRHPLTEAQVARTDTYARALDADDETMQIARDMVREGAVHAEADYQRILTGHEPEYREPTLAGDRTAPPVMIDPELVARLSAFHDLPEGSLGRAYIEFYDRNGFDIPGSSEEPAAMFVAHDMNHVIAGYEPNGEGEIALGGMLLAIADDDMHWFGFLGNLGVHEAGYLNIGANIGALARPGAADMVAHAFDRGARCKVDFTLIDHLALVDQPLEDVRAQLGVPPRER
jgi:hypothetical protein